MGRYHNPITPEHREEMENLAKKLSAEPNPDKRMTLQMWFVKDMGKIYGKDRAAKMLTQVWKMAKARV